MTEFLHQLRDRKVLRAGLLYCAAMFALLEFSEIAFPRLGIPDGLLDILLALGLAGLPVTLVLAWFFDARPAATDRDGQPAAWAAPATITIAAILFAVGVAAGLLFDQPSPRPEPATHSPRILVLPFEDLNVDPKRAFFAEGLSEDISSSLGQFGGLAVIPPSVTLDLDRSNPMAVASRVDADYVITGTIRQSASTIRITSQLIEVAEGQMIWAETFDSSSTVDDLFRLQAAVAERVVATVADPTGVISRIEAAALDEAPTDSLAAYECVLRGYAYLRIHDDTSHQLARSCLERAIELDSDYAEAWGLLAYLYREEFHHNRNTQPDPLGRATAALQTSLDLDRHHPMVAFAQAMISFSRGDNVSGLVHAERAVELNPSNATIVATIAIYHAQLGKVDDAISLADRVVAMHPTPPHWLFMTYATAHYLKGEYEDCLAATAKWNQENDVQWHYHRAAAFARLGRMGEAAEAVRQIRSRFPAFATAPRAEITKYMLVPSTSEPFLEGLQQAGLGGTAPRPE